MHKHKRWLSMTAGWMMLPAVVYGETLHLSTQWFKSNDRAFKPLSHQVEFKYPQSCRKQQIFGQNQSLDDFLTNHLSWDQGVKAQEQSLFKEYSKFWQHENMFYQLTAVWDYDVPARYRMEFFRSTSPQMNQSIDQIESIHFNSSQLYDAIQVNSLMTHVIEDYQDSGAVVGSDIVIITTSDNKNQVHEITFLNDMPVQWSAANSQCQMNNDYSVMNCSCEMADSHVHHHGGVQ